MAAAVQSLKVADLILDPELQPRTAMSEETIEEYREALERAEADGEPVTFPPIMVFDVDGSLFVTDGFHRVESVRRHERTETIRAEVRKGTREQAIIAAAGANGTHGLKRTPDDKRRAVAMVLRTEDGASWSDAEIARWCAVSHPFVAKLRAATCNVSSQTMRRGRDGRTYNTANIGKKPAVETPDRRVAEPKPIGQSRVNGVLQPDPPDVAKWRAEGRIAEDDIPEITEPESATTTDEIREEIEEAKGKTEDDLPDDDWLAQFPVYEKLTGLQKRTFREDAISYRRLEQARNAYARAIAPYVKKCRKLGAWLWAQRMALKKADPSKWLLCPEPKDGGCGGQGTLPGFGGVCPKCHGNGYWIC